MSPPHLIHIALYFFESLYSNLIFLTDATYRCIWPTPLAGGSAGQPILGHQYQPGHMSGSKPIFWVTSISLAICQVVNHYILSHQYQPYGLAIFQVVSLYLDWAV